MVHVLDQAQRGGKTRGRKPWKYEEGYIKWFNRVSHPIMRDPASVAEYTTPVPPFAKVIVEQQWAIQVPDPLHIILNIKVSGWCNGTS